MTSSSLLLSLVLLDLLFRLAFDLDVPLHPAVEARAILLLRRTICGCRRNFATKSQTCLACDLDGLCEMHKFICLAQVVVSGIFVFRH